MKPIRLLAAALAAFACTVGAQTLKPGLWEVTQQMQAAGGPAGGMSQMQRQMASMSPAERKIVEDMMAKRGVKTTPGGGMSAKVCMTREMVEQSDLPVQQKGDCRTTRQARTGNTLKMSFACTTPPGSGEGQVTFVSPEAYSMKMVMSTLVEGKPQTVNMDTAGRWVGADCGAVTPSVMPSKK